MSMEENGIRINKYLSESGICSRREADRQIEEGNVTIDGVTAVMGDLVLPGQQVLFNGIPAAPEEERILIAFNKPVGIVCTAEKREKDNIIDYIQYPKRVYPVGRLDKDSEGLILLTNQGEIVNKMMRSGNMHEKEYIVTLTRPVTEPLVRGLAGGVPLVELGVTTRPCYVQQVGKYTLRIVLTQGYNRQIRRMCDYFGFHVRSLRRVRVMNIELGDLPVGQYRDVTEEEYRRLMMLIRDSSNAPVTAEPGRKPRVERVRPKDLERQKEREARPRQTGRQGDAAREPGREYRRRPQEEPAGRTAKGPNPEYRRRPQEEPAERPAKATAFRTMNNSDRFLERQRLKEERRKQKEEGNDGQ